MIIVLSIACLLLLVWVAYLAHRLQRLDVKIYGVRPTLESLGFPGLADDYASAFVRLKQIDTRHARLLDYLDIYEKEFPAKAILIPRGNKATSEEVWNG